METSLFIIHLFSCFALFGLIWTIQLVHYPAFLAVDANVFKEFSINHAKKISFFVAPLMIIELLSGGVLVYLSPNSYTFTNFFGILILWFSTLLISMPCHKKLSAGKDMATIKKLIRTNWPRTIVWTVRSLLLLSMLRERLL